MLSSAAEMIRLGLPGSVISFFTLSSWCLHAKHSLLCAVALAPFVMCTLKRDIRMLDAFDV